VSSHYPTLGETLKARRKAAGWGVRRLSSESGVSRSMISRIERSECDITLHNYASICKALKIKIRIVT